jgi:hypothetical protein
MGSQPYEGKWEEIAREHGGELAGKQGLTPNAGAIEKIKKIEASFPPGTTLADAMKDYIGSVSSGKPCNGASHVKEIWGEYVMEKDRKRRERRK